MERKVVKPPVTSSPVRLKEINQLICDITEEAESNLDSWERDFLSSVTHRFIDENKDLSEAQVDMLRKIYDRHCTS